MRSILIIIAAIFTLQTQAFGQANNGAQPPRAVPGIPLQELSNGDTVLETMGRYWDGFRGLFSIRTSMSVGASAQSSQYSDADFQW